MASDKRNKGEALFERYLAQHGYHDWTYHPDWLNPPKKPDYLIRTAFGEVVVEVEGFEAQGLFGNVQSGQVVTQSLRRTLAPIRRAISRAVRA